MYCLVLIFGISRVLFSRYATAIAAVLLALLLVEYPMSISNLFDVGNKQAVMPAIFFSSPEWPHSGSAV